MLFAQVPDTGNEIGAWANVVSGGGFALLAWYLIAKVIPRMAAEFRQDAKEITSQTVSALKEVGRDMKEISSSNIAAIAKLEENCRSERTEQRLRFIEAIKEVKK